MEAQPNSKDGTEERELGLTTSVEIEMTEKRKHFSIWSAMGVQYSVTAAPLALGTFLSLNMGLGGSPTYFWGFLLVGFFQFLGTLAAAEIASAMPHSSGPAYWVIALATPRYAHIAGYILGWITNCAWMCLAGAATLYSAQLTTALAAALNPGYEPESWHTYLAYMAFATLALLFNLPTLFKYVDYLMRAAPFLINGTAIFLLVSLLVLAKPKATAETVFITVVNDSGWSSNAAVFLVGLLPSLSAIGPMDNAIHLADELRSPRSELPKVMLGSLILSVVAGLPMIVVYELCNVYPQSLLDPIGGQPYVQLLINAYGSTALTAVGTVLMIICLFSADCAILISWSRLYWSFSQNGSLPLSKWTMKLSSRKEMPLYALAWCTFINFGIGTISIGSLTAMNALLGASCACGLISFAAVFALALAKGRQNFTQGGIFNLGRYGTVIYWISLVWCLFMTVVLCLPDYRPVTAPKMNWTVVVIFGFGILSGIWWILNFSKYKAF